jgi:tripartite-type tricarboxylate transporter receptor subunit TctC
MLVINGPVRLRRHMGAHKMFRILALLVAALCWAGTVLAQPYPDRSVRIVVPFPPGGAVDILGRTVAQELSEKWKQPVVVDNKPGAGTVLGATQVAKAPPDGYTILLTVTAHTVNATLMDKLPFDPIKDFAPITMAATGLTVLVVNPALPVNSVAQLIAHAKANPGKLNFGSPGNGTAMHLSGEMFKSAAGINVVHVPYKGTQPVLTGLLAGEVAYTFDTGIAMEMVKAGRLKALAVTTPRRTALLPDLPTMAESGLPGFASQSWYGFLAPAGTPAGVIDQLNRDINEALQGPAARERLARIVLEPQGTTPAQFEQFLKDDVVKWRQVIKESGAKAD